MSIQSNLTEMKFEELFTKLQNMDNSLSISPVTPKQNLEEEKIV